MGEQTVPESLDWDLWLGPAPMRPYNKGYHPFAWRGWKDFGTGALGDMACHILGAPNMALHLSKRKIVGVECIKKVGASPIQFPQASVIRFDFAAYGDMPPLKVYWYDGMKANPKIEGVPEGEWVGDPPFLRSGQGQRRGPAAGGEARGRLLGVEGLLEIGYGQPRQPERKQVAALRGDQRMKFVEHHEAKAGEDGPDTYSWNEGIAP